MRHLPTRPEGLGALEYLARLALGPLILLLVVVGFTRGWDQVWTLAALCFAGLLLAVRWREFAPVARLGRDPGGALAPLTKLVMVGATVVVPLCLADGAYLLGGAVAVLAVSGAGLWLGWTWAGWPWIAYALTTMADWLFDLVGLVYESVQSGHRLPMSSWRPLLGSLPAALFAAAVLTWVLEWRRREAEVEPEEASG